MERRRRCPLCVTAQDLQAEEKQASSLDRSLLNSKRECDTLYTSFNDILSLPSPSAYEVRPSVLYSWTGFAFGNKQFIVEVMVQSKYTLSEWTADHWDVNCSKKWREWICSSELHCQRRRIASCGQSQWWRCCNSDCERLSCRSFWSANAWNTKRSLCRATICSATNRLVKKGSELPLNTQQWKDISSLKQAISWGERKRGRLITCCTQLQRKTQTTLCSRALLLAEGGLVKKSPTF